MVGRKDDDISFFVKIMDREAVPQIAQGIEHCQIKLGTAQPVFQIVGARFADRDFDAAMIRLKLGQKARQAHRPDG